MPIIKSLTLLIVFFLLLPSLSNAQNDSLYSYWAELSEDDASILERIQDLYENPVDINKAGKSEFQKIPFLNQAQIDRIIAHRLTKKPFTKTHELQPILGAELYNLLQEFLVVNQTIGPAGLVKQKNYFPLDNQEEMENYNGKNWYNSSKVKYTFSPSISGGLITHKDVGEANTFDYLSGYFMYHGPSWEIVLGKFNFRFGHGLAFANPFSTQKSAMVLNPLRSTGTNATPTLSTAENSGLFGVYTASQKWHTVDLQVFASNKTLDARLDKTKSIVTGFDYDGYHRTDSEEQSQDKITESTLAIAATVPMSNYIETGLLLYTIQYKPEIRFEEPVIDESDYRRQYYSFSGDRLKQLSWHYKTEYDKFQISGEYASNLKSSNAFSQKILFREKSYQFGVSYWNLSKNFQSPYGSVFDENSPFPKAQQGYYFAGKIRLSKEFYFKAYKFFKKDLWRTYFNSMPQSKDEWLIEANLSQPRKKYIFRVRQKTASSSASIAKTVQTICRLQYVWAPDKKIRLQSRMAFTKINPDNESGFYVFQDLKYASLRWLTLYSRITFFKTDSFLSALYEYENDLPGSYANYPLYNQGHKWYFLLKAKPNDFITLWAKLRYSKTQGAADESKIKRELRCQADLYFN